MCFGAGRDPLGAVPRPVSVMIPSFTHELVLIEHVNTGAGLSMSIRSGPPSTFIAPFLVLLGGEGGPPNTFPAHLWGGE